MRSTKHIVATVAACAGLTLLVLARLPAAGVSAPSARAVDYPVFGFDPSRSGINSGEHILTASTVVTLTRKWQIRLPDRADSTVVEIGSVPGLNGASVLYVTTIRGTTLALDAHTGHVFWTFAGLRGKSVHGFQITNASPVVDPTRQWVFAASPDGMIHKLGAASGREASGWPIAVTLHAQDEKIGSALNIYGQTLLVATGGYIGDFGHYQGHLVTIDLNTRAAHAFNTLCSNLPGLLTETASAHYCQNSRSGVWARGGAVVDTSAGSPTRGQVFIVTGNGRFDGSTNWGDSMLRLALTPGGGIALRDSYTPENQADLNDRDADLGSTTPLLLPRQPGAHPWVALQGGKDSTLRLLDIGDLSGQHGPGHLGGELAAVPMPLSGGDMFATGVAATYPGLDTLMIITNNAGLAAVRLTWRSGKPRLAVVWSLKGQATSPLLANGVLYVAGGSDLHALDPRTGKVLWRSSSASSRGNVGAVHWQSPTVVNGMAYLPDEDGHLTAYGIR